MDDAGLTDITLAEHNFQRDHACDRDILGRSHVQRADIFIDGNAQLEGRKRDARLRMQKARLALFETLGHLRLSLLSNVRVIWKNTSWQTTEVWSLPTSG
jgi:hypothetical protein